MSEKDTDCLTQEEQDAGRPKRSSENKDYRELAGLKKRTEKTKMVDKFGKRKDDSTLGSGGADEDKPSEGGTEEAIMQEHKKVEETVGVEGAVGGPTPMEGDESAEVMTPEQFEMVMAAQREQLKLVEDRQRQAQQIQQLADMKHKIAQAKEQAQAAQWEAQQIQRQAQLFEQQSEIRKIKTQQLEQQIREQEEELARLRGNIPEKGLDMGEKPPTGPLAPSMPAPIGAPMGLPMGNPLTPHVPAIPLEVPTEPDTLAPVRPPVLPNIPAGGPIRPQAPDAPTPLGGVPLLLSLQHSSSNNGCLMSVWNRREVTQDWLHWGILGKCG